MIKLTLINSSFAYDSQENPRETLLNIDHIVWFVWVPEERGHHRAHTQIMLVGQVEMAAKETPTVLIDRISKARALRAADEYRGRMG